VHVPQANGGQSASRHGEFLLPLAQLRDKLAAEDSSIVAQEDQDRGSAFPQRAEANFRATHFGENEVGEFRADRFWHGGIIGEGGGSCGSVDLDERSVTPSPSSLIVWSSRSGQNIVHLHQHRSGYRKMEV
jgi:hypothetical protein